MTDYPLDLVNQALSGGASSWTGPDWDDAATSSTLTLDTNVSGDQLYFELEGDHTAATDIVNFRIEYDVLSGSGTIICYINGRKDANTVIFTEQTVISGAGTYTDEGGSPTSGSSTYAGIHDLVERVANTVGFHHGWGFLDVVDQGTGNPPLVLSGMRVLFFSAAGPVARLYPRDDGRGIGNSPRIHPPTKANRIVGGYQ